MLQNVLRNADLKGFHTVHISQQTARSLKLFSGGFNALKRMGRAFVYELFLLQMNGFGLADLPPAPSRLDTFNNSCWSGLI